MSFRLKLLAAMMGVVLVITGATLYTTHRRVEAAYQNLFAQQSRGQIAFFNDLQAARLEAIKERCRAFAESVRLRLLMNRINDAVHDGDETEIEESAALLYRTAGDELREIRGQSGAGDVRAAFFRFLDADGNPVAPARGSDSGLVRGSREEIKGILSHLTDAVGGAAIQQAGYAALDIAQRRQLVELVFTQIIDPRDGHALGALVLGFPVPFPSEENRQLRSGVWFDGEIYSGGIPDEIRPLAAAIVAQRSGARQDASGEIVSGASEIPHRVFHERLNPGSTFPPAYQVCVHSMAAEIAEQRRLQWTILGLGGAGLAAALTLSMALAHGLSVPLRELVQGTRRVQQGDLTVKVPVRSRDETGLLAASFNSMVEGLALKEKYRSVLDLVADKDVAEDLMRGDIALGGETREVSVLFCDIRGFTAMTQNMDPPEVIELLNEHMTALTRVVYENNGCVDKFVGDLIMAIFGAPKCYGDDIRNSARAALRMIEERAKLNEISRYKIQVGIGLATGRAVAGRMGSADRLNYTVLGERVNLAARLCSHAGRMQVIIDSTTRAALGSDATVEPLPPLQLKGFSDAIQAFRLLELKN